VLEAKVEAMFERSLNLFERENKSFPVMLLANKQDLPDCRKADEVARLFASCFEPYENVIWTCRATCAAKKEAECTALHPCAHASPYPTLFLTYLPLPCVCAGLTEAVWWLLYEMEHSH
jgi:excinuclease UvrABC nuclease subunit